MSDFKLRSDVEVRLIDSMGDDARIASAAWVSTSSEDGLKRAVERPDDVGGVIKYLVKHRHGCYDSKTEVLTRSGWKLWPFVTGDEEFLTLNVKTDAIEWQRADRLVRKRVNEPMVRVKMTHVDLLVTEDHNMLAAPRTHGASRFRLLAAKELAERSHRLRMGGGLWKGDAGTNTPPMALIGFFIGDGSLDSPGRIMFHLRKLRKVEYLNELVQNDQNPMVLTLSGDDRYVVHIPSYIREVFAGCYTELGEKRIPAALLDRPVSDLIDLFDGLMSSDGSIGEAGRMTYYTTSRNLADQIQELAVKIGMAAVIQPHNHGAGHYGSKPSWRLTIYRDRNSQPRVGWTTEDRKSQVTFEQYEGDVHCVTVPNGTLYVRRNGIPCWCGNTPFEHSTLQFFIRAPIFVWREWHRHRVGFSYNEESARYKTLDPEFYIPERERPMMKVDAWKAGRPKFDRCEDDRLHATVVAEMEAGYRVEYARYLRQLERGIDPGLARVNLPVGIYSSCWVTCNPRSLMHFLSLRTHEPTAERVSYPLWEIELAAKACEKIFAAGWPITYLSFVQNGRVSP